MTTGIEEDFFHRQTKNQDGTGFQISRFNTGTGWFVSEGN